MPGRQAWPASGPWKRRAARGERRTVINSSPHQMPCARHFAPKELFFTFLHTFLCSIQVPRSYLYMDMRKITFYTLHEMLHFHYTSRPPAHSWAGVVHSQPIPFHSIPFQNFRFLMLKIHMINEEIALRKGGGIEFCIEILG